MPFLNRLFGRSGGVKGLVRQLRISQDEPIHNLDPVITDLAKIGKPAVQPLCALLRDGRTSYPVRCLAAIALVRIGTPSEQPLQVLLSDRNEEVRIVASAALMTIQKGVRSANALALLADLKESEAAILAAK